MNTQYLGTVHNIDKQRREATLPGTILILGGSYNAGTNSSATTGNTGNGSLVIITLSTN